MNTFYLVTPPGLDFSVMREFRESFPDLILKPQEDGGFEFDAELAEGVVCNRILKTPTRILVRLADFGCRDFPKLFKKMKSFDWAQWLVPHEAINIEVSTHESWLRIKRRIEETLLAGIQAAGFAKGGQVKEAEKSIYIRIVKNVCFISIDTSGEILHKRGYRNHVAEAPLRENIAAALLWALLPEQNEIIPDLLDPTTGSGTFLIEAVNLNSALKGRSYAYQRFPCLQERLAEVDTKALAFKASARFAKAYGFEKDAETYQVATKALSAAGATNVSVLRTDVFEQATKDLLNQARLRERRSEQRPEQNPLYVISNPPYGKRLKLSEPLIDYYARLMESCEQIAEPDRAGFVFPTEAHIARMRRPKKWQLEKSYPFSNGGIPVAFHVFGRKERL